MVVMQCWGLHVTCTFFAAYITVAPCRYWYRLWTSKVIPGTENSYEVYHTSTTVQLLWYERSAWLVVLVHDNTNLIVLF